MSKATKNQNALNDFVIKNCFSTAMLGALKRSTEDEKHRFFMAYAKNPQAACDYLYDLIKSKYTN